MNHFYGKKSKYHNERVTVDGVTYDSRGEYRRWCFLKMMEQAGEISNLRYHVNYDLIPKGSVAIIRTPDGREIVTKRYDRKRFYEADFVYVNKKGEETVEDFKGYETKEFQEKRVIFNAVYHRDIKIVKQVNDPIN